MLAISIFVFSLNGVVSTAAQASPPDTEQISSEEFKIRANRIRAHFNKRAARSRDRTEIVETTVTESGQTIDWVKTESQVPDGIIASPPPSLETVEQLDSEESLETNQSKTSDEESLQGPAGTVPVVRFDVERYIANAKTLPKNPKDKKLGLI